MKRKKDFLFNTGIGHYGLVDFQFNFLKVCIEDQKFYNDNWENINPNDYAEADVRTLLHHMRVLKSKDIIPSYDNLILYINSTIESYDKAVLIEILKEIRSKESLDEDEVNSIKASYMFFGLYAAMVSMSNNILDWAKSGVCFGNQVISKFEQLSTAFENAGKTYNKLLIALEDFDKSVKDNNSWNE